MTLDDFTEKTGSNNLIRHLPMPEKEKIVFGKDCHYTFRFDGITLDDIEVVYFIIKHGVEVYKVKTNLPGGDVAVEECEDGSFLVTSFLTASETSELGKQCFLDNSIQVKLELHSGHILYGDKVKLIPIKTLDN